MKRTLRRIMRKPFLVMGPDIHGPTIYHTCRTLRGARRISRGMEQWWTIVKIVHPAVDLRRDVLSRQRAAARAEREPEAGSAADATSKNGEEEA